MSMKLQSIILAILTILNQIQEELDISSSWIVTVSWKYIQCISYVRLGVPHDVAQHPYQCSVWYLGYLVRFCFGLRIISLWQWWTVQWIRKLLNLGSTYFGSLYSTLYLLLLIEVIVTFLICRYIETWNISGRPLGLPCWPPSELTCPLELCPILLKSSLPCCGMFLSYMTSCQINARVAEVWYFAQYY